MSLKNTIQKNINKNVYNNTEIGTVTTSGKEINVEGLGEYRQVPLIAPFGILWNPPQGENVELVKNWRCGDSIVAIGTIVDKELPIGEIELFSLGGANIKLKNDGTVIINEHLIIRSDGSIEKR